MDLGSVALRGLTQELLAAMGDLDLVLDVAARTLSRLVGDTGYVRLVSPDGVHLEKAVVRHPDPEVAELVSWIASTSDDQRADAGLSGVLRRDLRPVLLLDPTDAELRRVVLPEHDPYLEGVGVTSLMAFPLVVEGEYLGYVAAVRDRGSPAYTAPQVAFAEEVAGRTALSVGQAHGSRIRRQRSREQQAQLELGLTALGPDSREVLWAATASCLLRALGGDWVQVAELVGDHLVTRASVGSALPPVAVGDSTYAQAVLEATEPVVVHDLSTGDGVKPSPAGDALQMHSGMTVAVRSHDELLGALAVHQRTPRRFSREERDFLQAMATTVASGLVRRRTDDDLAWRAHHDPLTGLANRTLLLDRLEHALLRGVRTGTATAVLFLDLDRFKAVNDRLGHAVGDDLLRRIGTAIVDELRPGDTAARLGGDEFVLVCEDLQDGAAALLVAERVRARVAGALDDEHRAVLTQRSTLSIGVALAVGPDDAERLIRDADAAMYRAKTLGGNRVELFDGDVRGEVLERIRLRRDLAVALSSGTLTVVHQPVADLRVGTVVGTEALARWTHPERGVVAPAEFIAAADGTHLIDELGEQVLRAACRQATRGVHAEHGLRVSVNVSPHQLQDPTAFCTAVEAALDESGLAPGRLCLEITEQASVSASARGAMRMVGDLGVRWSLDDFGTGYASLAAALELPIAQIKLDRSLVHDLASRGRTEVLQAIASVASAAGYECVAEGVETDAERRFVQASSCTHFQGYLLARPMPPDQLGPVVDRGGPRAEAPRPPVQRQPDL